MTAKLTDERDDRVLLELQTNSDRTNTEMAEAAGMTPAAFSFRKEKLKADDFILRIHAVLDHKKLGLTTLGFVMLKFPHYEKATAANLTSYGERHSNIVEIHTLFGEFDVLVKMRAVSPEALLDMVSKMAGELGASNSQTLIAPRTSLERTDVQWDSFIKNGR